MADTEKRIMYYCRYCGAKFVNIWLKPYCPKCGKINPNFVTRPQLEKLAIKMTKKQMDLVFKKSYRKENYMAP